MVSGAIRAFYGLPEATLRFLKTLEFGKRDYLS